MQPDSSTIPHGWLQLAYLALATILSSAGTLIVDRLVKRRREPHEIDKLRAETKSIHITAENAQVGVGLETLREIQAVIDKAERRREEWQLREDQMRTQIIFWRNKAEELDGELIDSRQANGLLQTRLKMKQDDLDKAMGILKAKHISFAELDQPEE